jgi:hypothetical protein
VSTTTITPVLALRTTRRSHARSAEAPNTPVIFSRPYDDVALALRLLLICVLLGSFRDGRVSAKALLLSSRGHHAFVTLRPPMNPPPPLKSNGRLRSNGCGLRLGLQVVAVRFSRFMHSMHGQLWLTCLEPLVRQKYLTWVYFWRSNVPGNFGSKLEFRPR